MRRLIVLVQGLLGMDRRRGRTVRPGGRRITDRLSREHQEVIGRLKLQEARLQGVDRTIDAMRGGR